MPHANRSRTGGSRAPCRSAVVTLLLVLVASLSGAAAQTSTRSLLVAADLGLPELVITATDDGWDAPAEIAAGRYLLTVSYDGNREYGTTAFALLPEDWTIERFNQHLAETNAAFDATPVSGEPPVDPDLSWIYEITLAGGVSPTPGSTEQAIVDLRSGTWAIWADEFVPPARQLVVTGEPPAIQPIPEQTAAVTAINDDSSFRFQIEGELLAGPRIVEVTNLSRIPIYIEFVRLSHSLTDEQLAAFLLTPVGLAPDPALGIPADFSATVTPFYSAMQSPGITQWIVTNFEPGSYGMVCWLPDPDHDGASLASLGMVHAFDVT
ncbi:MAG: hypothetical protein R2839_01350 [Thermomicrobiales bacterium]